MLGAGQQPWQDLGTGFQYQIGQATGMTVGAGKSELAARGFQSGRSLTLRDSGKGGGEGRIYQVVEDPTLVAKIYHPNKRQGDQLLKLQAMLNNPPVDPGGENPAIAWPVDLVGLRDRPEQILGFLMPRVDQVRPLHHFYTPKTRREEIIGFTYHYLLRMARNLAATFHAVHERGYVVGDVNESNILASSSTLVTLVDTDSFQVPDGDRTYRCGVGKPEFTPPELHGKNLNHLDRTPVHDAFGLAVLIFQLLMEGTHPFDGVYTGRGDPPLKNQRIIAGHFPYGKRRSPYKPKPIAPAFRALDPDLQRLFQQAFEAGHRHPQTRPDAQTWVNALDQAEDRLKPCQRNDRHVYSSHQKSCPWCDRTEKFKGRDPFPSRDAVRKGEHRQPVRPKQKRPRIVVDGTPSLKLPLLPGNPTGIIPIPGLQQLPATSARLYWLSPGYSRPATIVSLVGLSACILIPTLIILNRNHLNFATPGIPDRIPQTSQPNLGEIAMAPAVEQAAIAQFPNTQRQLIRVVDQTTIRIFQNLKSHLSTAPGLDQLRPQVVATLGQLLELEPRNLIQFPGKAQESSLTFPPEQQRAWVRGLYRYQRNYRNSLGAPLRTTGQFDIKGKTRAALEQDLQNQVLKQLGSSTVGNDAGSLFPNQQ